MNGQFTKGQIPWNKGRKRPEMSGELHPMFGKSHKEESIEKMRGTLKKKYPNGRPVWNKGRAWSEEAKKKMSMARKGKMKGGNKTSFKKGQVSLNKGKKLEYMTGEKNPNWKGGVTTYEKILWFARQRRVKKLGNGGSHTLTEWQELKKHYNYMCLCCKRYEPEITLSEDHIIPLSKGGSDNIENIQPLCRSCNSKKNNKIKNYLSQID